MAGDDFEASGPLERSSLMSCSRLGLLINTCLCRSVTLIVDVFRVGYDLANPEFGFDTLDELAF